MEVGRSVRSERFFQPDGIDPPLESASGGLVWSQEHENAADVWMALGSTLRSDEQGEEVHPTCPAVG